MAHLSGVWFPEYLAAGSKSLPIVNYGSRGGPTWDNTHVHLDSGAREVLQRWSAPLHVYDARFGVRGLDDFNLIRNLWMQTRGSVHTFGYKDFLDYTSKQDAPGMYTGAPSATDVQIGVGDGTTTQFQLIKPYTYGGYTFNQTVRLPVVDSVLIAIDGTPQASGWSVNADTGNITFTSAPANLEVVTAGFEHGRILRFDESLDKSFLPVGTSFEAAELAPIPMVEDPNPSFTPQPYFHGNGSSQTVDEDLEYSFGMGAVVGWDPTGAHNIYMPDASSLIAGLPIAVFENRTTFSSSTLTFKTHDGASTLFTMAAGNQKYLFIRPDAAGALEWSTFG